MIDLKEVDYNTYLTITGKPDNVNTLKEYLAL